MRASAHKAETLKDTTDQGVISPYAQPLLARLILDPLAVGTLVPLVMAAQVGPHSDFRLSVRSLGPSPHQRCQHSQAPIFTFIRASHQLASLSQCFLFEYFLAALPKSSVSISMSPPCCPSTVFIHLCLALNKHPNRQSSGSCCKHSHIYLSLRRIQHASIAIIGHFHGVANLALL